MYVLLSDPSGTGAASASLMATVTHWITAYGVPMLVGIMAVGFVVMLLIKFAKRSLKTGIPFDQEDYDLWVASKSDSYWDSHG